MSLARYMAYRDSGVSWLPTLPSGWKVSSMRHTLVDTYSGGTPDSSDSRYWAHEEDGLAWVAIGDMTRADTVTRTDKCVTVEGIADKRLRILPVGTLLYSMYASLGKVAVLGIDAAINQAILALVPDAKKVTSDFLCYWLMSLEPHLPLYSSSNTQDNLNAAKVRSFPVFLPSLAEQRCIASFLRRETAKIDALVEEQERLMALLKEKRQAVIAHAVTKGLNSDAPQKSSGVEWLGEIPSHWDMLRLSEISDFIPGKAHEPYIDEEGSFICVTSRFVATGGDLRKHCTKNLTPARVGDTLMVMSDLPNGRALAKCFFVDIDLPLAVNQRVCIIRPISVYPRFGYYLLDRCPELLQHDDGMNQTHLSNADILKPRFPIPPFDEQQAIVEFLDSQLARLTTLGQEATALTRALDERRAALIAAAVTGQIDVRHVANADTV